MGLGPVDHSKARRIETIPRDQLMAKRHQSNRVSNVVRHSFACSAAALAMTAGASTSLAQSAAPAAQPGSKSPGAIVPSQGFPSATQIQGGGGDAASGGGMLLPGDPGTSHPGTTAQNAKVKVDDNLVVDLHVNDEDLANVLQMLSIQSQRNIVASNNVNAKVKADLYGVTFYEALDAILHVNGYGYIDKGNFIYVYTLEELQQIEKASRVRVSKVINLNYLNAIDAAEFVKPLLSEGGQIKTNGKTKLFPNVASVPVGADDFANSDTMVLYDYQNHVDEIEKLVKQIDQRPAQVVVEATILQTQLTEDNAWGVDFSLIADLNFSDFASPLAAVNDLILPTKSPAPGIADGEGRAIVGSSGNTAGPGTLKLGLMDNDVAVFVKMLDQVTDTNILSNPKILALNRQPSRVLVGRKVGYLNTTSTDTTTTQSVEFLDTGTQLYFRPFVANDGMIRMELKPQVSEAIIRDTKDSTGSSVTIPDEITNELVTNVLVRDGQTIVLGGLFRESTTSGRRQVPFLGDIPFLGAAFRGQEDSTKRDEIIFLITPTIQSDPVLAEAGKHGKDYVERARVGAREGLLPWSRDRMTGGKLIEAQKAADAGNTQEALWKVQQSLALNPMQPDAIAMRERLGGDKKTWPNRSMLDSILHREMNAKSAEANPEPANTSENLTQTFSLESVIGPANSDGNVSVTGVDTEQSQPVDAATFNSEPVQTEPVQTEPVQIETLQSEPAFAEPAQSEPMDVQPVENPGDVQPVEPTDELAPQEQPQPFFEPSPLPETNPSNDPHQSEPTPADSEPAPDSNPGEEIAPGKELAPAYLTEPLNPTLPPTDSHEGQPATPPAEPKGPTAGANPAAREIVAQLAQFVSWCETVFNGTDGHKTTLSSAQRR